MELIDKYFPGLTELQRQQFAALYGLYADWNAKINVCLLYTSPSPRDS